MIENTKTTMRVFLILVYFCFDIFVIFCLQRVDPGARVKRVRKSGEELHEQEF